VTIGDAPYQLSDEGFGTSLAPIYQHFVEQAKALKPRYPINGHPCSVVHRWKGLDEFRESMLADDRLRSIDDYLSAWDIFPGVGGRAAFASSSGSGTIRALTSRDPFKDWPVVVASRPLSEDGVDVFIRFN